MKQHDVKTWQLEVLDDGKRVHLSYTGSAVILPLIDFNSMKDTADMVHEVTEGLPKLQKQCQEHGYKVGIESAEKQWKQAHTGKNNSEGCGRLADAEILAMAVRGVPLKEIKKARFTYNRLGHKKVYGERKIYSALSVKKPEDRGRILGLYVDFPKTFDGVPYEAIERWFWKKYKKGVV